MRPIGTFIVFTLFGALAPPLCMFLFYAVDLMRKGIPRDAVPIGQLVVQEMALHTFAVYGAIAGAGIGLIVAIAEGFSMWRERRRRATPVEDAGQSPDELIRTDQIRIADEYMAGRTPGGIAEGR